MGQKMRTLRLIGRGYSDTLEQLLRFTLLTLAWWLCVLLIVPIGPATVALFAMTDPRQLGDAPDWPEVLLVGRRSWRRGWLILLATAPLMFVLIWNIRAFATSAGRIVVLEPFWLLLLLIIGSICAYALAAAALLDLSAAVALRQGMQLAGAHPVRAIVMALAIWLIVAIGTALVVPMVMFVPALTAAIVNRFALDGLGIPVTDVLAPTEERMREERSGQSDTHHGLFSHPDTRQ